MKKIMVVWLMFVGTVAMAGTKVNQAWEAPVYGTTTNGSVSYTFTGGKVGVLDNVWITSAPAVTNTITFTLVQNNGAMTNALPSISVSNGLTTARWTASYLMALGDVLTATWSAPALGSVHKYAIWTKDVEK